ncbi:MAG: malto-oligosyltrehalose synthase, partial [Vicinamibacteria bacterium]
MQKSQPPISTYRVQLRSGITFEGLRALVDYFQELGISHLYLSPILRSESTSAHGYSVVDFERIDPRVGTVEELSDLARTLSERGMGLILDFVPNHMSASPTENRWWRDVLELGPRSIYAHFFDVDWNRPDDDLRGRVLAPVLAEPYTQALEKNLGLTRTGDGLWVAYRHQRFPLAPSTWTAALRPLVDDPELARILSRLSDLVDVPPRPLSFEAWHEKERLKEEVLALLGRSEALRARADGALAEISRSSSELSSLLSRQAFRLTHIRHAATRINYRRFFDISGLVAIRSEDPEVFDQTHRSTFELLSRSGIEGLRIDHIDGLLDPKGYLEKLPESYVVVEKILERGEALRDDWPVSGTTGYEALNRLQRLFVEPKGFQDLVRFFEELTFDTSGFEDVVYRSKIDALETSFEADVRSIADPLAPFLARMSRSSAPSLDEVRGAVRDLVASFPVYRTYLRPEDAKMEERDRVVLASAVSVAKRRHEEGKGLLFDRLASVLALEEPSGLSPPEAEVRLQAALRLQQLTGPAMAKGAEDTAFYRHFPLLSLNEVGGGSRELDSALEE